MSVYCSLKFTDIMVSVQSRLLYNCCKASPERINLSWLENNPGKLFLTPTILEERKIMLENKRCKSCETGCYKLEDEGLVSPRLSEKKDIFIDDIYSPVRTLQLSFSTDCNLTCAYCSSLWSTAWLKDLKTNGEYNIKNYDNQIDNWTSLWNKLKQKERSSQSKFFQLLLKEIQLTTHLEEIQILGGEPLLHNSLDELINTVKDKKIKIITGLGVSKERLLKLLEKIKDRNNISFVVSAENTNELFEFVRYNSTWKDFLEKLNLIKLFNKPIKFISTVSNLTVFGLMDFYKMFGQDYEIDFNPVAGNDFMYPNVIDETSKEKILKSIPAGGNNNFYNLLSKSISTPCSDDQKERIKSFLLQFSKRRNLSLDVFPKSFLEWLNII